MKRILITSLLFAIGAVFFSACGTMKNTNKALEQEVNTKITKMQELVGFDDEQAAKLRKVELNFLKKSNKVKNCKNCDVEKSLQELQQKKTTQLQTILKRHQYIKYDAIENNRIKKGKLMAK